MSERRIHALDAVRGLALYVMLYYHFVYDLALFGLVDWDFVFCTPMNVLERTAASVFILLAGISSRMSRNNLRRGVKVLLCAVVVELASSLAGVTIRFGVLTLLGSCMVLYGLFGKYIQKLPEFLLECVCIPAFGAGYAMYQNVFVSKKWLYPLGLRSESFVSADYFPLIPWAFMFLLGTCLGGMVLSVKRPSWLTREYPRFLTLPGRNTLIIYMLHQPVLYAIAWGISELIR
ncbi:MAG: heparan-alpha-glucosaminide N-acetyltransferase [Candidatus Heteroscillospira sp.]